MAVGLAALALGLGAPDALAQRAGPGGGASSSESGGSKKKKEALQAPIATGEAASGPWFPLIAAILLLGMIVGVNFLPSKRGHQD
jgi:hypothetical protein